MSPSSYTTDQLISGPRGRDNLSYQALHLLRWQTA